MENEAAFHLNQRDDRSWSQAMLQPRHAGPESMAHRNALTREAIRVTQEAGRICEFVDDFTIPRNECGQSLRPIRENAFVMLDVNDILCIASAMNEERRDARRSLPSMSTDASWSRNAKLLAQKAKFHSARKEPRAEPTFLRYHIL